MKRPTCHPDRHHKAYGMCDACWMRWRRAGRPAGGPPAPDLSNQSREGIARANAARRATFERNLTEYIRLRAEARLTTVQARDRMGLTDSTAYRYESLLQEQGVEAPDLPHEMTPARKAVLMAALARAHQAILTRAANRCEDYVWLRDQGEYPEEAARRVGVSTEYAERTYEPTRRAGVAA